MKNYSIDINCDVGEGVGNEAELLPLISSCNIACGGHAGDLETMTKVIRLAKQNKVRVGAHPSYPDKDNFGRVSMNISSDFLVESIREQLKKLALILNNEGVSMSHIKPHGALYNAIAKDVDLAKTFLKAINEYKESVFLYVPYESIIKTEALKQNFNVKIEAFGDRNYNNDLSLVSRNLPEALIINPEKVLRHIQSIIIENKLMTLRGNLLNFRADTFCIHGDTPTALQILVYLTKELPKHNITIKRE